MSITITRCLAGWVAVMVDDNGEPVQTGFGYYGTPDEADQEAREWAEDEGIRLSGVPPQ